MTTVNRKMMILESLVSALGEEVVPKITTKVLAQRSDVTEAALYKHFKGKNEIFLELFAFIEQTITDKIWEIRNQSIPNYDKIRSIFFFMVLFVEKNPGFARILTRESLTSDEIELIDKVNVLFVNLEREFTSLGIDSIKAKFLVSQLQGIYCDFIRGKFKTNMSEYMEFYYTLLQKAIA